MLALECPLSLVGPHRIIHIIIKCNTHSFHIQSSSLFIDSVDDAYINYYNRMRDGPNITNGIYSNNS